MSFLKSIKTARDSKSFSNQTSRDSSPLQPKTFVTSVYNGKNSATPGEELINDYFEQLNLEINHLGLNMHKIIKKHEDDFVSAFKGQLNPLYKELSELKQQNSKNQLNLKRDSEVSKLHELLSSYERELASVSESANFYKTEVDKLKAKVHALNNDKEYLEEEIVGLKHKLSEALNELRRLKSLSPGSELIGRENLGKSKSVTPRMSRSPPPTYTFVPVSKAGYFINEIMRRHHPRSYEFVSQLEHFMIVQENKFLETVHHYKKIIDKMKVKSRNESMRKEEREKSQLETLFLKCVEDIHNEKIKNRRNSRITRKLAENSKQTFVYDQTFFTSLDRRKLIEKLLDNDYVLDLIYTTMFNKSIDQSKQFKTPDKGDEESVKLENLEEWLTLIPNNSTTLPNTSAPSRIMTPAPPSSTTPDVYHRKHRHYFSNIKS
jgi:hypothetical protein